MVAGFEPAFQVLLMLGQVESAVADLLDAMIATGGLTPFASGNRTKLIRKVNGRDVSTTLRLSDLLKDGDLSANVELRPGDPIIIPQSFF